MIAEFAQSAEPRSYLDRIAVAYFMAPSETHEERLLDKALQLACRRHGVSLESVVERVSSEFADVIDAYQEHDAEPARGCCGEFETGSGEHSDECAEASS